MPIYSYKCVDCDLDFDEILPSSGSQQADCPKCSKPADKIPSTIGGYHGNMGSGSTRPRNAGAMKGSSLKFRERKE